MKRDRVLVVDASIVVDLLARFKPQPIEALLFAPDTVLVAPELLDIEVLNALRKLAKASSVSAARLADVPVLLRGLRIRKYRHESLLGGIWTLRENLTANDAAYVVLARLLGATLLTRDARLAKACIGSIDVMTA